MSRLRTRGAALLLMVALTAAACGGSDDDPAISGDDGGSPLSSSTAPGVAGSDASCAESGGFTAADKLQDKGTEEASGAEMPVDAGDFFFEPTCITNVPSGTFTLTVHNTGQALHNVTIADQDIDVDVEAGETITVDIEVGSEPVQFVCKYHRTSGMVGALVPAES